MSQHHSVSIVVSEVGLNPKTYTTRKEFDRNDSVSVLRDGTFPADLKPLVNTLYIVLLSEREVRV